MSQRTKAWGVGIVCLVIIQMAASLLSPRTFGLVAVSDIIQFILLFSAAISCLPNILKNRGRTRLFWLLMGLGLTAWWTYQLLWTYIEVIQQKEVPNLFTGDVILFLHLVPMIAALALQPNIEQ